MSAVPPVASSLTMTDERDVRDLELFLTRAVGVRDGVARLVVRGSALAIHVAATFPLMLGAGVPTIVGQRGVRLGEPTTLDVVVPISEVRDRLARMLKIGTLVFDVPPSRPSAPWTATLPLDSSWTQLPSVSDDAWLAVARGVASRVRDALPTDPGQAMVFQAREALWAEDDERLGEGGLAGAAFVADAYGFIRAGSHSRRFMAGPWQRLSALGGTLLWRRQ